MADEPKAPVEIPIPESLRRQLDQFRRRLWRNKISEALLAGLFGLVASFLIVFALDRVWQTPGPVRLGILIGGTSLAAIFAPLWLHRWVWRHRRENQLARLIAKKYPGLGDRLLGVVELQGQKENADTLSPRLRAAAMEQVAAEAERRKLDEALPSSRSKTWGLAVVSVFALAAGGFMLAPKAGWSSLKRWLMPLSTSPRYTFTSLENVPVELTVPQGEAFRLSLTLGADSEWTPENGTARYGRQDPVAAIREDKSYHFDFPAQQDPGVIKVEIGDAKHSIKIIPHLRPAIRKVFANVSYPDYLQLPAREVDLGSGVLTSVQGSKVSITADATRDLKSATYGPLTREQAVVGEGGTMSISGTSAQTPPLELGENGFTVPISWTDTLGLAGQDGFEVRVDSLPDGAPGIYIQGVARQHAMLPDETIDFQVASEDDFGLRRIGLEWKGEFTRATDETPATGEMKIVDGGPTSNRLSGDVAFSPATHNIVPQKLTLRAWAEDYLPGRPRAYSEPVTLFILTLDEHAQMLKTQFDRSISELEDLARRERDLFEENQRLEMLDDAKLQEEDAQKRLQAQQEAERQQTERMQDLAEKMEKLFKDSARNESIDKETMKKMADAMQSMKELSQQDMPEIEKKLGDAQDQKNSEEKAKEDVKEAVEQQKEALEKMQDAVDKANDANERFEASTFVNRLKKAATEETGIATTVIEPSFYERTAGMRVSELDPSDSGKLVDIVRQQSNTTSDVRWIQEDLSHFHARTNKEAYRKVLEAMAESRIDVQLEDVRRVLEANQGALAWEGSSKAAAKLNEWAKLLEGEKEDGGGGEGGGDSGGQDPDEDFEFMLRVMKMIQQEQDIRARTRSLETLRRSYEAQPAKP
ncbi:hypothetical protein OKA04_17310 [Luteolibacter flavescens]|uniref:TIGR02302 family protein n=1 Tax=Luteolibacter flavescens TaxID=1859460 RepID=A0ABT3FSF7_9BACT|nr:hypothetical protein [Luteolibacter flavescens]MCW1886500.1 hypothetical protein [Luteolibacter flavescens]